MIPLKNLTVWDHPGWSWYYTPPIKRTIFLVKEDQTIVSYFLQFPYIVFGDYECGQATRSLYVYFTNEKPQVNTNLIVSPLPNLSNFSGNVCLGRNQMFSRSIEDNLNLFWNQPFTIPDLCSAQQLNGIFNLYSNFEFKNRSITHQNIEDINLKLFEEWKKRNEIYWETYVVSYNLKEKN